MGELIVEREGGPVAHGPEPTCTPVSLGPCGDWDRRIYLH